MAEIKNTLARLHKLAERINQKRQQSAEAVQRGVAPVSLEASVLAVRGAAEQEKARNAMEVELPRYDRLSAAYFAIRNVLATANVDYGVSTVLAEQDLQKRRVALLTAIVQGQGDALSQAEATQVFASRDGEEPSRRGLFRELEVTSLSPEHREHVKAQLAQSELRLERLNDKLAEINARTVKVTLDDVLARELGLLDE